MYSFVCVLHRVGQVIVMVEQKKCQIELFIKKKKNYFQQKTRETRGERENNFNNALKIPSEGE